MSAGAEIERLEAEARYRRERLALLRARMYRGAATPAARMRQYERALEEAERRLRRAQLRDAGIT